MIKAKSTRLKYAASTFGRIGWHGLSTADYATAGELLVTGTELVNGKVEWERCHRVSTEIWERDPRIQLQPDDLLLTKDGTIGKVALVDQLPGRATLNSGVFRIVPNPRVLTPRYGYWVLNSKLFSDFVELLGSGSTINHLYQADVVNFALPLPSIAVQRKIERYLDRETARIDALIAAKRRIVQLLDVRWQVVMHNAVAGRLTANRVARRASSVPWLTDVPSHWREGHLKLVAQLGTGHTPSRSHPEWWVNLEVPWITTGEVAQMRSDRIEYITETRERISELGMSNSSAMLHPAGTVVLCRTASAGYAAIMGREMATSQDFATWTCGPLLRPRFLLLCLRAMRQDLLGRLAMGSTHKTIYMPDIESIKVPIPPVEEQDEIVTAAYSEQGILDQSATCLTTQVNLLQERREALVTSAVTGELEIPEAA